SFVRIPRNPSFSFGVDVTNRGGAGEASSIAADYCMSVNLVTNEQYQQFLDATHRTGQPRHWSGGAYREGKATPPGRWVSLTDAEAYCAWQSTRLSGWSVRLPTEAEWENAARGPEHTTYPWGNSPETTYHDGSLSTRYNYNGVCAAHYLAHERETLAT